MSVKNIFFVFITGDLMELVLCIVLAKPMLGKKYKLKQYKRIRLSLLKESLPQTGVVIFTAIMSRLDWILIGLFVSSIKLAEYSFAWKAFEVSTLPLLIIAPMMIPLFTRMSESPGNIRQLTFFLEWQIIIAAFTALLLNVCWTPVIDFITDGKYGAVNTSTIFLLSLSMPLLYFNNYLWTINFANGHLRRIFIIMAISFAVNIISCSILIPLYKNEGAAIAYFITLFIQLLLYLYKTIPFLGGIRWYNLFAWPLLACATGFITKQFTSNNIALVILSAGIYFLFVFVSKQVQGKDWKLLQSLYQ